MKEWRLIDKGEAQRFGDPSIRRSVDPLIAHDPMKDDDLVMEAPSLVGEHSFDDDRPVLVH